jgi:hypothetical protein
LVSRRRPPTRKTRLISDKIGTLSIMILAGSPWGKARSVLKDGASHAGRVITIDVHLRTEFGAAEPERRACTARLDDPDADIERSDYLPNRVDEAFDSPFACVIEVPPDKNLIG